MLVLQPLNAATHIARCRRIDGPAVRHCAQRIFQPLFLYRGRIGTLSSIALIDELHVLIE